MNCPYCDNPLKEGELVVEILQDGNGKFRKDGSLLLYRAGMLLHPECLGFSILRGGKE